MAKKFLTPIIMRKVGDPPTPAAGDVVFFARVDGHLYSKDDAGVVRQATIPVTNVAPASPATGFLWVDTT